MYIYRERERERDRERQRETERENAHALSVTGPADWVRFPAIALAVPVVNGVVRVLAGDGRRGMHTAAA